MLRKKSWFQLTDNQVIKSYWILERLHHAVTVRSRSPSRRSAIVQWVWHKLDSFICRSCRAEKMRLTKVSFSIIFGLSSRRWLSGLTTLISSAFTALLSGEVGRRILNEFTDFCPTHFIQILQIRATTALLERRTKTHKTPQLSCHGRAIITIPTIDWT